MPIVRTRALYVSPLDDCHAALLALAEAARVSLFCLIYGFTLPDLAAVVLQKHQDGLKVGIVADKVQSARHTQKALLQRLVDAGVPVTVTTSGGQFMHLKVLLVDHEPGQGQGAAQIALGSYNWSAAGQHQANVLITDSDPMICAYFWARYEALRTYGEAHYPQPVPRAVRQARKGG